MRTNKFLLTAAFCSAFALSGCNEETKVDLSKYQNDTFLIGLEGIKIEVGETYDLSNYTAQLDTAKLQFIINKQKIASVDNLILKGLKTGTTPIYAIYDEQFYQEFSCQVVKSLSADFTMDWGRLHNKKVWFFGDSVTYGTGLAEGTRFQERYSSLLMDYYGFAGKDLSNNFAIPGTTMTYEFVGSHIYDEYHANTSVFRKNGTSLITSKIAYTKDVDYVFIAYTHNDQYFQIPIGTNDDLPKTIEDCNTFKGCYAYAIHAIQKANPKTRIVIIAPNYSKYGTSENYDIGLRYPDYIQALEEIAAKYQVKYINLWPKTEEEQNKPNVDLLADTVHLNAAGHKLVAEIIKNS